MSASGVFLGEGTGNGVRRREELHGPLLQNATRDPTAQAVTAHGSPSRTILCATQLIHTFEVRFDLLYICHYFSILHDQVSLYRNSCLPATVCFGR